MQEKILLVDDREDNLFSMETILEQDGYQFATATSGKQALKILLSEFDFALILMDVKMPNLSGFETATLIYEREKLRHIPIIFITAQSYGEENVFKGYKAGAVDYIYKPINPDLLRAKVSVFIELYKNNHKLIELNKRLEEEKTFAESLIENSVDIIAAYDKNLRILSCNRKFEEQFKLKKENVIGNHILEIFPYLANSEIVSDLEKALKGETIHYRDRKYLHTDGYYESFIVPLKKPNGEIFGALTLVHDITNLKKNEEQLQEINIELRNTREQLANDRTRFLLQAMPHIVATASPEGLLNYCNQLMIEYTGLPFSKIEGWDWIKLIHADDVDRMMKDWKISLDTQQTLQQEFRLLRSDGQYFWHLANITPNRHEDGSLNMWIVTLTNIHEQKMIDEKKDEFIALASHELKTPLTSAKAYAELLLAELSSNGNHEATFFAQKTNVFIDRLNNLISDLLDIAKIQHGKLQFKNEEFDLNVLLDETIEMIQKDSTRHQIIKSGEIIGKVAGDKDRIRQVLCNLLTNAIKYSPNAREIDVVAAQNNGEALIAVKDYGVGIRKDELDKVFKRFYRGQEKAEQFQGLGIGLYLSAEITKQHNGRIWVDSEPNKGSTFYISLPQHKSLVHEPEVYIDM